MTAPLDADAIRARIPHRGRMALLAQADDWNDTGIRCLVTAHAAPDHPLRSRHGLLATAGIEFAAQATALHQALVAEARADGGGVRPGFIASVRDVRLHRLRLDDVAGALTVSAERLLAADRQAQYRFSITDHAGQALVEGRLTVVLDTPLTPPALSAAPRTTP